MLPFCCNAIPGLDREKKKEEPRLTLIHDNEPEHAGEKKEQNTRGQEPEKQKKSDEDTQGAVHPDSTHTQQYQVKEGETYFSIAKKFSISAEELMSMNNTKNTRLNAGDIILVPKK